jgi:hypothetical protein
MNQGLAIWFIATKDPIDSRTYALVCLNGTMTIQYANTFLFMWYRKPC